MEYVYVVEVWAYDEYDDGVPYHQLAHYSLFKSLDKAEEKADLVRITQQGSEDYTTVVRKIMNVL